MKPPPRKYRKRGPATSASSKVDDQTVTVANDNNVLDMPPKTKKVTLKADPPTKSPAGEPKKTRKYTRRAKVAVVSPEEDISRENDAAEAGEVMMIPPEKLEPRDDLVNNEYCSACSGAGSLICCEACPRSFHFTCADPPMDPDEVPEEHWFCNECRAGTIVLPKQRITTMKGLFDLLIAKVDAMNPKAFGLPKRIRKIAENEGKPEVTKARSKKKDIHVPLVMEDALIPENDNSIWSENEIEHSPVRNGGRSSIVRERLSDQGYCHKCCRSAHAPHQLLISCDSCSLRWHLDCLPYPLAVYPSAHRHWDCPLHLNEANLFDTLSSDVAARALSGSSKMTIRIDDWPSSPPRRNVTPVVSESSIRLQFGWTSGFVSFPDRIKGCTVPATVQEAYRSVRSLPYRDVKLLKYYESYSYADSSVETETF